MPTSTEGTTSRRGPGAGQTFLSRSRRADASSPVAVSFDCSFGFGLGRGDGTAEETGGVLEAASAKEWAWG